MLIKHLLRACLRTSLGNISGDGQGALRPPYFCLMFVSLISRSCSFVVCCCLWTHGCSCGASQLSSLVTWKGPISFCLPSAVCCLPILRHIYDEKSLRCLPKADPARTTLNREKLVKQKTPSANWRQYSSGIATEQIDKGRTVDGKRNCCLMGPFQRD